MAEKIGRTPMSEQPAQVRAHNFQEVALGYTLEDAQREASRCLNCKKPFCVAGCPVQVPIPEFITAIKDGDMEKAAGIVSATSALPAVCGRVCPQEEQCEKVCVLARKGEAVAIGRLERYVADAALAKQASAHNEPLDMPTGSKVAIVGAGPAGLTAAGELCRKGYRVTVFEALHAPGGVLVYGIPEFRLPKALVRQEIQGLERMGVQFEMNTIVGRTVTIEELFGEGYKAVFVGSGAGLPRFMNIPGENLSGVYSANEYLTRINLMGGYDFPTHPTPVKTGRRVAVVGGGNVAMDAARCALRMGAEEVHIVYRRSMDELPARLEEIHHAKEEGVIFDTLVLPTEILAENGWVSGLRCTRMVLGEPDESGRRRPVETNESFDMPMDTVVMAIGTSPNPLIASTTDGLEVNRWGGIIVDDNGATSYPFVYAGGDAVTGAATVILAMGAGKVAAQAIDERLRNKA